MKNHYTSQNPTHLGLAWPLRKLLLVFLLLGCTCALHAQTTTWTGATNIDWATSTNWSTNAAPTVNDNVEIPSAPANQPTLNTAASIKGLHVQSGATLILSATGNLMLPDAGISNDGTLTNNGTITISTTSQDGVYNTGLFQNKPTGTLRINKPWGNGIWNLNSSSTVINEGKIFIGDTDNTGVSGILNYGTFTNKAMGEIHIDRSRSNAIANTSSFTNLGTITIGALVPPGGNAIENLADVATFTNEACALIRAFSNVLNTKGSFTNNGYISVNSVKVPSVPDVLVNSPAGVAGSYTFSQANFGANVNSVNLTANGVFVDDATVPNPTQGCSPLVNAAQLSGKIALIDRGVCNFSQKVYYAQQAGAIGVIVFNNVPGGESVLVTMAPGAFADQVTIPTVMLTYEAGQAIRAALAGGPVNISIIQVSLPSPPITNQGVISFSYPLGIPIPNVTNNDIIARAGASCGNTLTPALQLGGSVSFTVGTTWYKDEALTMPAGTYNQQTNTFTITNLAAGGTYPVYFSVADNDNACTRTVSIPVTVRPAINLTTSGNTSVTYGYGSSCTTLTANASGGTGTLSLSWNTGATSGSIQVCPTQTTTYTVTATDAANCSVTKQITVTFNDVRCGYGGVKVCLGGREQCIAQYLVPTYLRLGATLGGCNANVPARLSYELAQEAPFGLSLKAYPNPVHDAVTVEVLSPSAGLGTFQVLDLSGRVRQSRKENLIEGLNEVEFRLGILPTGIYLIKAMDALNRQATIRVRKE